MRKPRALWILGMLLVVGVAVAGSGKNHQKSHAQPIPLGVSGGNAEGPYCFAGTLGCLVTDGNTDYILSNNHVFSRTINNGTGDDVIQPGLLDNGCTYDASDVVALVSQYVNIDFSAIDNRVDAAIAAVQSGAVNTDGRILGLGNPDGANVADATVGLAVKKSGRTTGVTKGTVQFTNVTIDVNYDGPVARFVGQIAIGGGGFSSGGDSGALIVTNDLKPVALLFAGGSGYTFANPIQSVLDALGGVTIVGDGQADGGKGGGGGGGGGKPDKPDKPGKPPKSRGVLARHGTKLLATAGVHGHGVGRAAGREVIGVFVEKDTPALRAKLPRSLEGIPVKIVVTGKVRAYRLR